MGAMQLTCPLGLRGLKRTVSMDGRLMEGRCGSAEFTKQLTVWFSHELMGMLAMPPESQLSSFPKVLLALR